MGFVDPQRISSNKLITLAVSHSCFANPTTHELETQRTTINQLQQFILYSDRLFLNNPANLVWYLVSWTWPEQVLNMPITRKKSFFFCCCCCCFQIHSNWFGIIHKEINKQPSYLAYYHQHRHHLLDWPDPSSLPLLMPLGASDGER